MAVRELLKRKPEGVVTVEPSADVGRAAWLLMEHGIGGLPVVESDDTLVGFVSEREIVGVVHRNPDYPRDVRIAQIMRKPAPVCGADDRIRDVMERMTRERLRHLVVVDGGPIVGVISVGDLLKDRLEQLEVEAGVLRDYVAAQRARR